LCRLRPCLLRLLRSIRRPLARMLILRKCAQRSPEQERCTNPTHYRESLHQ
jgi:hypothetical protein